MNVGSSKLGWTMAAVALLAGLSSAAMVDRVIVRPGATDMQWVASYTGAGGVLGGGGESGWYGFGPNGATPMLGDFNNDGIDDLAVVYGEGGEWKWQVAYTGSNGAMGGGGTSNVYGFGSTQYTPRLGDFNGDGRKDLVLSKASGVNMEWIAAFTGTNGQLGDGGNSGWMGFGASTDNFMIGDYDGNGYDDRMLLRTAGAISWLVSLTPSLGEQGWVNFGANGDTAVTGDFNGDGLADLALWRAEASARKYIALMSDPTTGIGGGAVLDWYLFGNLTDSPITGDFNGDGRDDLGIVRVDGGSLNWLVSFTGESAFGAGGESSWSGFGSVGDTVLVGTMIPEPATMGLLLAGGLAMLARRKR